jgi:hypothetical protein
VTWPLFSNSSLCVSGTWLASSFSRTVILIF